MFITTIVFCCWCLEGDCQESCHNDAAAPLTGSGEGLGSCNTHLGGISGSTASCQIVLLPNRVDYVSNLQNHFGLRDKYRYFACLLRARFDEHKNEKDMVKATQLLREAEEEFWHGQHPQPYIFPESPGGTAYERYECYKVGEDHRCVEFQTSALETTRLFKGS